MKNFLLSILCCLLCFISGKAEITTVTDVLNRDFTGVTGTNYTSWSGKTSESSAVYAGQSAGGNSSIQLRSNNSNSGIITTISGGKVKRIVVAWNSSTASGRTLDIYGKNSAYTSPTELYNSSNQGTKLGSIKCGTSTTLEITGDYTYIGLRSASSAMYLASIEIVWEVEGSEGGSTETPKETVATPEISAASTTFNQGESVSVAITTATEGATIHYTTNGDTPTAESAVYSTPIEITTTTTVKAIAIKEGWNNSEVVETTFTAIDPTATNFKIVASEQGYANAADVKELTFGAVTATFDKGTGGNAPKYYNTGTAIRTYGGNTITFAGAGGVTITEIKFTFASGEGTNTITATPGTFSTNTWTGASNEVVFTIGGTSGHRRIATIEVTYSVDENVVVIATPSITSSTSFVGSTTVEITNNEEGTTLYYSTNGEDYTEYTGALTITETTTVYAYSQDAEGNKSSVADATFTKINVLTIAEAKAAYDAAGANVDVAVDLTGAVVTVNSGQYLFIENETTGINLYNSGANYAVGTKFTAGYILGTSTVYNKMHQITSAKFNNVETTTVAVEPTEVEIADIKGYNAEYEGRFVKLSGVSLDATNKTITQGEDTYTLYNRFDLTLTNVAKCDIEGVVAIYNTIEQLYITKVSPIHTLHVTDAGYATLFLDFAVAIPAAAKVYAVTAVKNGYVSLTQIEGVLPANTGVIVEATEGDYDFVASEEEVPVVADNKLLGTTVNANIDVEAYVLSVVNGEVGLYKAEMNGGVFLNNANKAYLPVSALPAAVQGANGFKFRFETTGVEGVQVAQGKKVIFDLSGRKVNEMTAPGIYIVNGKKVLVK